MRATTAQLYPGRDTFGFDQAHVTKNQPITVLILLSESHQFCFRITNSPIADVFIVWANCEDKRIRGFILEKVCYKIVH